MSTDKASTDEKEKSVIEIIDASKNISLYF